MLRKISLVHYQKEMKFANLQSCLWELQPCLAHLDICLAVICMNAESQQLTVGILDSVDYLDMTKHEVMEDGIKHGVVKHRPVTEVMLHPSVLNHALNCETAVGEMVDSRCSDEADVG